MHLPEDVIHDFSSSSLDMVQITDLQQYVGRRAVSDDRASMRPTALPSAPRQHPHCVHAAENDQDDDAVEVASQRLAQADAGERPRDQRQVGGNGEHNRHADAECRSYDQDDAIDPHRSAFVLRQP